ASIAFEAYRLIERRAITLEVEGARSAALASARPAMIPADAKQWLASNGFHVVVWNPHDPNGFVGTEDSMDGVYLIVMGQRQIRHDSWLAEPMWLNLTFRFTLCGFLDFEAKASRLEVPAN